MTDKSEMAPKPEYKRPNLTVYGSVVTLTAGGSGSTTEAEAGNNGQKNRS
jgi:hypothetical protein